MTCRIQHSHIPAILTYPSFPGHSLKHLAVQTNYQSPLRNLNEPTIHTNPIWAEWNRSSDHPWLISQTSRARELVDAAGSPWNRHCRRSCCRYKSCNSSCSWRISALISAPRPPEPTGCQASDCIEVIIPWVDIWDLLEYVDRPCNGRKISFVEVVDKGLFGLLRGAPARSEPHARHEVASKAGPDNSCRADVEGENATSLIMDRVVIDLGSWPAAARSSSANFRRFFFFSSSSSFAFNVAFCLPEWLGAEGRGGRRWGARGFAPRYDLYRIVTVAGSGTLQWG